MCSFIFIGIYIHRLCCCISYNAETRSYLHLQTNDKEYILIFFLDTTNHFNEIGIVYSFISFICPHRYFSFTFFVCFVIYISSFIIITNNFTFFCLSLICMKNYVYTLYLFSINFFAFITRCEGPLKNA